MKTVVPLTWKILLIALANVGALVAIAFAFVQYELGHEFTSMLLGPGRDRTVAIASQLALDLNDAPVAERDALLERYGREHAAAFLLYANDGVKLAGAAIDVPPEVLARITARGRGGPPELVDGRGRGRFGGPPPLPGAPPFLVTTDRPLKYWTGIRIPVRARDRDDTVRGTVLLASTNLLTNPMYVQPMPWIAVMGVTLGVTALCWIPFVRGVTRSIADMTRATAEIARGRFDAVPALRRRDELGVLASSIAVMAARLHALVSGQQRFLRDAAHELRSPLGRLSLAVGLLERESDDAVHRRAADVREDIAVMSRLTDDLLAYARTETEEPRIRLTSTNVHDLVERAVRVEAAAADVRVDIDRGLQAHADADLLFRAVSNLVRNAVAYAGTAGPIDVRARRIDGMISLSVSDRGPGVPEVDVDRVFLPFYRPEDSRDRRSGGAGLGLAIVRSSVEACGGSVSCRNLAPGFEVTVTLPTAPAS
jgi:two-component system, OmpR family, sensor histidine kinase CpxA